MELLDYLLVVLIAALVIWFLESRRRRKIPKAEQERDDSEGQQW